MFSLRLRAAASVINRITFKVNNKFHTNSSKLSYQMIISDGHLGAGSKIPEIPNDGKLVLYSMQFCPFAQRIHLVLDAKKIPYNTIFVDLVKKPEWLRKKSPMGKVPALQIPGVKYPLIESLPIADYLDEKYPDNKLNKTDLLGRTQDRIIIEAFQKVISSLYLLLAAVDDKASAYEKLLRNLEFFEEELKDRSTPYFGGVKPGMIDYMIWPWFERSQTIFPDNIDGDNKRIANLIKWRKLMKNDEAVKCTYISPEDHIIFFESRQRGNIDFDILLRRNKSNAAAASSKL